MSTHNFKIHDTNKANIWSDSDYNNLPERTAGYVATNGIKSKDFNTFMREASLQAVAISDLLVDPNDGSAANLGIESDAQDVKAAYLRGLQSNIKVYLTSSAMSTFTLGSSAYPIENIYSKKININRSDGEIYGDDEGTLILDGANDLILKDGSNSTTLANLLSRLDQLGFKEGNWSSTGESLVASRSFIKKQGKYVIATADFGSFSINASTTKTITLQTPNDFKPKENTKMMLIYTWANSQLNMDIYEELTLDTNGSTSFEIVNRTGINTTIYNCKILNTGWELA